MPAYKDKERGTWYCKFYYEDWTGARKQKKKRGFNTQREAKAWEKQFLDTEAHSPDTTFNNLLDNYYEHMQHKITPSSMFRKKSIINTYISPTFGNMPINKITPKSIMLWQEKLRNAPQVKCKTKTLSSRTIQNITSHFSAALNYAVKYYDLPKNPFIMVDKIKCEDKEMEFWEIAEYQKALQYVKDTQLHIIYQMLFFGGFRIGELLALTKNDLICINMCVSITKTYELVDNKWVIGPPKSTNSVRMVALPKFVWDELNQYISLIYAIEETDEIFSYSRDKIRYHLYKTAKKANVKKIRIHDLRHSHVSYLINLGFSTFEIADRIGDTPLVVEKTYAHLYQSRRQKIAQKLQLEHQNSLDSTKIVPKEN